MFGVGLPDFREGHVEICAKMEKYLIFPGLSKGICRNGEREEFP